jgi:predicted AlkP superfamily phosphohydrolase/phosphomutase
LYYFLRKYEKPQISFLIRALNDSFKNELKIVVENLKGEKKVKRIHINSRKWKKEILDLSSFRNQIIKVSFYHFGEAKNVTEIKNPYFKDRYSKEERKVIMIGLDGATWKIIDSLIEKGKLQNLNKLIKSGARGNLKTIKPWYSPLVWTSILTGKNKEKHGIKGFIAQRRKTGETIPNSRLNRKCLAIWNILSGKKHVVGIVGPWVSWPAEKVNGYILSDRMFFENLTSITFPSELKSLLFQKIKPYKIKMQNPLYSKIMKILDSKIPSPRYSLKSNIKNEKIYLKQDDLKQYAGLYLNNIFRPDFFFLYMRGPDVTSHFFWKYFEPDSSVSQEEIKLYGKLIPMNYIYQDYVIGKYISKMDSNTTFIIVSDHGMDKKGYKPVIVFDNIPKLFEKIGIYNYSINKIKSN